MKFRIHKALAVTAAVAIMAPVAGALADTVPVPNPLPIPELPVLPLPITIPAIPNPPAINYPNPEATLGMLQGQIELIAAALGQTPEELLNTVLGTEIPTQGSLVMTVNDLLNRLAGTTIFDAASNGVLGTTEIGIGNISHSFNMGTLAFGPASAPRCVSPAPAPCVDRPNPALSTLPTYSKVTSDWLPSLPAASVLGTSALIPTVNFLSPGSPVPLPIGLPATGITIGDIPTGNICLTVTDPVTCQASTNLIKTNLSLVSEPGGKLVNIQGSGFVVDGVKKGVHNGGTGSSGIVPDTGFRGIQSIADPSPVWLPLLTATSALADSSVDFLGFSPAAPTVSNACANNKTGTPPATVPTTYTTDANGVQTAHWPASTCTSSGRFSGFGIAVYGPSEGHAPVNFRTDLAPLWGPTPVAVEAISQAVAIVVASLTPYLPPTGLTILGYPPVTFALGLAGVATNLQGQLLALTDDLPFELPDTDDPTGTLPELPTGELPELPIPVPTLP